MLQHPALPGAREAHWKLEQAAQARSVSFFPSCFSGCSREVFQPSGLQCYTLLVETGNFSLAKPQTTLVDTLHLTLIRYQETNSSITLIIQQVLQMQYLVLLFQCR